MGAKTYDEAIEEMAEDFIAYYKEEITEMIKENKDKDEGYIFDEVIYQKWDITDKIHEWLDSDWYGFLRSDFLDECKTQLSSCAEIIDSVHEIETDSGLWDGQEPEEAIMTKAFFSVRNDLYWAVEKKIKELIRDF